MNVVLIIMVSFSIDGGVGSQMIPFKTMALCESAKATVIKDIDDKQKRMGIRNYLVSCVQQ